MISLCPNKKKKENILHSLKVLAEEKEVAKKNIFRMVINLIKLDKNNF